MFGRETRMLLRHYLEQGTSKSALARQLGVSRDTIHRWIRDGDLDRDLDAEPVRYGPRPPVRDQARCLQTDHRSAARRVSASCRPCGCSTRFGPPGYAGGYTQLKAFVRRVRPTPPPEPVIRFETPAGPPGASGLRALPLPVGRALRLARGARLLAVAVVPVLSAPGHGDADGRARGGVLAISAACRRSCSSIR